MRDAVSELGLFSRYAMESGEEGDGADYGFTSHWDGIHRQNNPDADRVWDDPEPLVALLAQEEQAEFNAAADELLADVEIMDEEGYTEPSYEELGLDEESNRSYDTGWLNRQPPTWYTWADLLAEENTACDDFGFLMEEKVIPDADDLHPDSVKGVSHVLRRLNRRTLGKYSSGRQPDNFRRKRQRITRPRQAAAKAKEMAIAA